ncbi:MAG: hypothetical protein ACKV0T_02850 [Planctomycetales bacterium]
MAIQEFWESLRTAEDQLNSEPNSARQKDSRSGIRTWLNPLSVYGFDERDFAFMDAEDRNQISKNVTEFRRIAEAVAKQPSVAADQVAQARSCLQDVIDALSTDDGLSTSPELFVIQSLLNRLRGEDGIVEFDASLYLDSTGDEAVEIWVIVDDEVPRSPDYYTNTARIREKIRQAFRRLKIRHWPYIHFQTATEHRGIIKSRR